MKPSHGCGCAAVRARVSPSRRAHAADHLKAAASAAALCAFAGSAFAQQPTEYRTLTGVGNNLNHSTWGSAGARYLREASGAHYTDNRSNPPGASRPSPRVISNAIVAQGKKEVPDNRGLSTCVYEFGQFLDHDFGLAQGGAVEPLNIQVPLGDIYFDPFNTGLQWIPMMRSGFDPTTGITSPRQQINTVSSFIDASQIYGSDPVRAAWLRSHTGGHLKMVTESYGEMLPHNDGTLANDNPLGLPATSLYVAGDVRANEQPGLTTLHIVFAKEHNWQADRLHAAHPTWDDERLYQEARRFVGAEMQVITYNEFLPALLGRTLPPYTHYKSFVNPGMSNAFAAAAYRIGHSMVGPDIGLLDENFVETGEIALAEGFFNPNAIPDAGGIQPIIRYFISDIEQTVDTKIVDPLRNFLFGPPGSGGLDLASLNIQRGRDHGLGDYNTIRQDFGLPRVHSFSEITADSDMAMRLQALYGSVNNIDAWVGMLAEDHVAGASVGPTHMAVLIDQFTRLRDGDRFWYQNVNFSMSDLAMIEGTRLSDIFRRNTGVVGIPDNVFFAITTPTPCYANCDQSTAAPTLNANDFQCFLSAYAAGDPYANCDQSTAAPVLNAVDFQCFINAFSAGCT